MPKIDNPYMADCNDPLVIWVYIAMLCEKGVPYSYSFGA